MTNKRRKFVICVGIQDLPGRPTATYQESFRSHQSQKCSNLEELHDVEHHSGRFVFNRLRIIALPIVPQIQPRMKRYWKIHGLLRCHQLHSGKRDRAGV